MLRKTLIAACLFAAASCTGNAEQKTMEKAPAPAAEAKPDFSMLQFASQKDTTCGMPISAGVLDTAVVDGKIYGFCSKECKDEFEKKLQAKK